MSIRIRVKRRDIDEHPINIDNNLSIIEDQNFAIFPLKHNQTDRSFNQNIRLRVRQNDGPYKQSTLHDISGFKISVSEKSKDTFEIEESPIKFIEPTNNHQLNNGTYNETQSQLDSYFSDLSHQLNSLQERIQSHNFDIIRLRHQIQDPIPKSDIKIDPSMKFDDINTQFDEATKIIEFKENQIKELQHLLEKQHHDILEQQELIKTLTARQNNSNDIQSLVKDELTETINQSQTESNRKLAESALKQEEMSTKVIQLEEELKRAQSICESQKAMIDQITSELAIKSNQSTRKEFADLPQQQTSSTPQPKGRRFSFFKKKEKNEHEDLIDSYTNVQKQLLKQEKTNLEQKERITELEQMILRYEKLVQNQDPSNVNIEKESKLLNNLEEKCEFLQNEVASLSSANADKTSQIAQLTQNLNDTIRQLDEIQNETKTSRQLIKTYEESMNEANRRLVDYMLKHNELEQQLNAQIQQSKQICEQQQHHIHNLEHNFDQNEMTKIDSSSQPQSPNGSDSQTSSRKRKTSFRGFFKFSDDSLPEKGQDCDDLIPAMKNLLNEEQKKNEELQRKVELLEYSLQQQSLQLKQKKDLSILPNGQEKEKDTEEEEIDETNQIRKIRDLHHTVQALQEELLSHVAELKQLRSENKEKDQNFMNLTIKLKSAENQLHESQQEIAEYQKSLKEANDTIEDLTKKKEELENSLTDGTIGRSQSLILDSNILKNTEDQSNSPSNERRRRSSIQSFFARKSSESNKNHTNED